MSDSASELRSRRALLTGGLAGLAALVASAVLRPLPTSADDGDPILMGFANVGGGTTLVATDANLPGLTVYNVDTKASIEGRKDGNIGPAVKGENTVTSNGSAAVYGVTNGTGPAVFGEGLAAGNGTSGVAKGTGSGVYGRSDNGRGGRFSGKKAQIRLDPATTTTHPATGDAGDIFLDKSKRLWLCKGGTSWVRILTS